jgi:hypothetical protein
MGSNSVLDIEAIAESIKEKRVILIAVNIFIAVVVVRKP